MIHEVIHASKDFKELAFVHTLMLTLNHSGALLSAELLVAERNIQ